MQAESTTPARSTSDQWVSISGNLVVHVKCAYTGSVGKTRLVECLAQVRSVRAARTQRTSFVGCWFLIFYIGVSETLVNGDAADGMVA